MKVNAPADRPLGDYAAGVFYGLFGRRPTDMIRAPGRVNLIGEHTDYNGGYVLPMAIERETVIVARPRADRFLHIHSHTLDGRGVIDLSAPSRSAESSWLDYVVGVAELLGPERLPQGADALVVSNVPMGSGLSSSAAFEMALLGLFEVLGGFRLEDGEAARLGQRVERDYLGLNSGIMDQYVSRAAQADHALYLHCDSLLARHIPMALEGYGIVVADTCCSRRLSASVYNERVRETAEALAGINRFLGETRDSLDGCSLEELEAAKDAMSPLAYRRARHFFTENLRTSAACEALRRGDAPALGALMDASHESLRDDYEVSSRELDLLRESARALEGCIGARMTGAGFGGCTVNLVRQDVVSAFQAALASAYRKAAGRDCRSFATGAAAGLTSAKCQN